jgi:cell division protease FtsH
MITRFGMHEKLGQMTYDEPRSSLLGGIAATATPRSYSEETAREIDCAVRELTAVAYQTALDILTRYQAQLEEGAQRLLEKETLLAAEMPVLIPSSAAL